MGLGAQSDLFSLPGYGLRILRSSESDEGNIDHGQFGGQGIVPGVPSESRARSLTTAWPVGACSVLCAGSRPGASSGSFVI